MEIKLKKYSSTYIVEVIGDMDLYNSFQLRDIVTKMSSRNIKNYIINFEKVNYIDSSGIGVLIQVYSTIKKMPGKLLFCGIHGSVKKVIELTKLAGYFPIEKNLRTSLVKMQQMIKEVAAECMKVKN